MDLANGCHTLCIVMEHTQKGKSKIVKKCTLPLTGKGTTDILITELAVFKFRDGKMILEEISANSSLEEIRASTEAEFTVAPKVGTFS